MSQVGLTCQVMTSHMTSVRVPVARDQDALSFFLRVKARVVREWILPIFNQHVDALGVSYVDDSGGDE